MGCTRTIRRFVSFTGLGWLSSWWWVYKLDRMYVHGPFLFFAPRSFCVRLLRGWAGRESEGKREVRGVKCHGGGGEGDGRYRCSRIRQVRYLFGCMAWYGVVCLSLTHLLVSYSESQTVCFVSPIFIPSTVTSHYFHSLISLVLSFSFILSPHNTTQYISPRPSSNTVYLPDRPPKHNQSINQSPAHYPHPTSSIQLAKKSQVHILLPTPSGHFPTLTTLITFPD